MYCDIVQTTRLMLLILNANRHSQSPTTIMTMPTSTSRSIWKALAVRFLFLTSVSSFVFYTTWRSPEKSRLRNTALDDLLVTLDNPQISPLPGGGFCNYLYHIQDGRNEVRGNYETKRGSVSAVCQ